jgi:hypothetical protein
MVEPHGEGFANDVGKRPPGGGFGYLTPNGRVKAQRGCRRVRRNYVHVICNRSIAPHCQTGGYETNVSHLPSAQKLPNRQQLRLRKTELTPRRQPDVEVSGHALNEVNGIT